MHLIKCISQQNEIMYIVSSLSYLFEAVPQSYQRGYFPTYSLQQDTDEILLMAVTLCK